MKKILLVIGLLSYGPSMCASGPLAAIKKFGSSVAAVGSGVIAALSPSKAKTGPMDHAEQNELILEIEDFLNSVGFGDTADEFMKPNHERYFDIPHTATIQAPFGTMGNLIRTASWDVRDKDMKAAIQYKYFSRGGKPMIEEELRDLVAGYDLPKIAAGFTKDPLLALCINPFEFMLEAHTSLADAIERDRLAGNADAQTVRDAYPLPLWERFSWEHDESFLRRGAQGGDLGSEEFFKALAARKDDARAAKLVHAIKKQVLAIAQRDEIVIATTVKKAECSDVYTWLNRFKTIGIEVPGPVKVDDFIAEVKKRSDALDAWEHDEAVLSSCLAKGELTDEGLTALRTHVGNPFLAPVISDIQSNFRTIVIDKEMNGVSTLVSIARLEKWLNGLKDAGVVLNGTVSIDGDIAQLATRKTAVIAAQAANAPKAPDANNANTQTSRFTLKRVALGIGLAAGSYLAYTKFKKHSDASMKTDTASAV